MGWAPSDGEHVILSLRIPHVNTRCWLPTQMGQYTRTGSKAWYPCKVGRPVGDKTNKRSEAFPILLSAQVYSVIAGRLVPSFNQTLKAEGEWSGDDTTLRSLLLAGTKISDFTT